MTLSDNIIETKNVKNTLYLNNMKILSKKHVKAFIDKVHRLITIAHAEQWTEVKLQNEISKEAGKELTE